MVAYVCTQDHNTSQTSLEESVKDRMGVGKDCPRGIGGRDSF
jgi:hypothetical protein